MNREHFIWGAAAAVFAVLAAGSLSPAEARTRAATPSQPRIFSSSADCYMNPSQLADLDSAGPQSQAVATAATCEEEARRQSRRPPSVEQLSFAYFHSGKANRLRGEMLAMQRDPAGAGLLAQAERQFNAALSINQNLREGPLELARLHRLQGRYDEARGELGNIGLLRPGDPAVSFEQAMVQLGRAKQPGLPPEAVEQLRDGALEYLSAFGNAGLTVSAYVVYRGPLELALLANDLGRQALARNPLTPEDATLAAKRFERAKTAVDVLEGRERANGVRLIEPSLAAEVYFNLGRSLLRQSTPVGDGADATGCGTPVRLNPSLLGELQRSFEEARKRGLRDAAWGLGCVQMARGDFLGAIGWLQGALPQADKVSVLPTSEYYLALARAQARSLQVGAPDAATRNAAVQNYTAALNASDPRRRVALQLELAQAFTNWGMQSEALASLTRAVGASSDADYDPSGDANPIPDAYLVRGEILQSRGNSAAARANFQAAAGTPWAGRARAYYRLSLLQSDPNLAVQYATDAFLNATEDAERRAFQRSACLVRIVFNKTADQGQFYCSAERRDDPDALFYEGVFWLREAYRETGGQQRRNWAQALRAFEAGLTVAQPGQRHQVRSQEYDLRDTLSYGKRFALQCSGLGAANTAEQGDSASDRERSLFTVDLGLNRCWR